MNIYKVSYENNNQTHTIPNFKSGVKLSAGAKETILKNLPDFYAGTKPVEKKLEQLGNIQINLLRMLNLKPTEQTKELANADIFIRSIHLDPATKEKFYLYEIPQISSGLYSLRTNQSLLETPNALLKKIVSVHHKAEINNRIYWTEKLGKPMV